MSLIMEECVSHVPVMMSGFVPWDPCGLTEMIFGNERLLSRVLETWLVYEFTAELLPAVLSKTFTPLSLAGAL